MLDKPKTDTADVERRRAAFEHAAHSQRIEGRVIDPTSLPEYPAVVEGTMSFDEAAKSIAARRHKS